jgi:phosphoribosyl 1,2-cyclic phosphate phosphodiesterase
MELTILGSGGCMTIPKPLCQCTICKEARVKGIPYARTGPALFLHDLQLLIDTPAEISTQLNRENIQRIEYVIFTHLDPDHVEGIRVLEQLALDFRTWKAYPEKRITIIAPHQLISELNKLQTVYGSIIDYYHDQGFIQVVDFDNQIELKGIKIMALPISRQHELSFVYVFESEDKKIVYAPCDIKPFPEACVAVHDADLLIIQPGIIEGGLKYNFVYPENHISRTTLYTFEETLNLRNRIRAKQILFIHLEEYWNKSFDDYLLLSHKYPNIQFAWDGMHLSV